MRPRLKKLVLVIAVLGLAALIWLIYWGATAGTRDAMRCLGNLQTIKGALFPWITSHQFKTPPSLETLAGLPGVTREAFVCPATGSTADPALFPRDYDSLFDRAGRPLSVQDFNDRARTPLVWDREAVHQGGRYVLFADGSVRWVDEDQFATAMRRVQALLREKQGNAPE